MLFDFSPRHDASRVLRNPGKGWYHHLFDNGIGQYQVQNNNDLLLFPGLDHIYLRLPWSYLEPRQGQFNWALLDEPIQKWTALGLGVSFRVTCKESHPDSFSTFATPEWVKDAGARGEWVEAWGHKSWMPEWGDPIFLKYLSDFHRAFAARYARQPWLRYVDVGSYGQWGEGHNYMAGGKDAPVQVVKRHIQIHRAHYPDVPLLISDDIATRNDAQGPALARWIEESGLSWRDDSILVQWYAQQYAANGSVRSPELFERVWRERATILELQHYPMMKDAARDNTWRGPNGSEAGGAMLRRAMEVMRPSYIGYHGPAREWLADNPEISNELANRCGYWLFPTKLQVLAPLRAGGRAELKLSLQNRGVAPPYRDFSLKLRLSGPRTHTLPATGVRSRGWLPGEHQVTAQAEMPRIERGKYLLSIALFDGKQAVQLGLREEARDGFYEVGVVEVR